jgi:heat-inducible transcriptional repressor
VSLVRWGNPVADELSAREKQILYAAVSEFVQTGEPVASRALQLRGIDLSPATIRSVLAELEESGYLRQPHTSAGRVPTDLAFRVFIDALMELRALSREDHDRIRDRLRAMEPGLSGLRETGKLLSEMTGAAAVLVAHRPSPTCKHLRFLRTGPSELLAVLVLVDGSVRNRFLPVSVAEDELVRVHNLLDDIVEARTLADLRAFFSRRKDSERVRQDPLRKLAFELAEACVVEDGEPQRDVVVEGRSRLIESRDFSDPEQLKQLLSTLDNEAALVRLVDSSGEHRGPSVVMGAESESLAAGNLALVSAPYSGGQNAAGNQAAKGVVAVLGPTRMDYPKVLPIVAATATAMANALLVPNEGKSPERELPSDDLE